MALAVLAAMVAPNSAWADSVYFHSQSATTTGGAVAPGATLTAGINYSVDLGGGACDSVNKLELLEGTTVLATRSFTVHFTGCGGGDLLDELRTGTITAGLGVGVHRIYVRAYSFLKVQGDSSTYTVTVTSNAAPTATMTAPANGATYIIPTGSTTYAVPVTGSATDSDGTVSSIDIVVDGSVVQTVSGATVNTTRAMAAGSHTVKLVARDSSGATDDSSTSTVTVKANVLPTASLTAPTNGSAYTLLSGRTTYDVPVKGAGADTDGSVTSIDVVIDGVLAQTITGATVNTTRALAAGTHTIKLVAKDNLNGTASSSTSNVTVNNSPASFHSQSATTTGGPVAPGGTLSAGINYSVDLGGGACDSINKVELREGTTVLATRTYTVHYTGCGGGDLLDELRTGTLSANLALGTHQIYVRAYSFLGVQGDSTTYPVTVTNNVAPTATMTAPANGAKFIMPPGNTTYSVPVKGSATDSDGTVASFDIVIDGTKVQTVTGSSVDTTSAVGAGSHTVKLVARDNLGGTDDSSVSTITVAADQAPTVSLTTPANGATYTLGAGATTYNVPIKGSASDTDGSIASIDIVVDGTTAATVNAATVDATRAMAAGSHTVKLVGQDNLGAITSSSTSTITVARSPVTFDSQSATSTGGSVPAGGTLNAGITFAVDMGGACDAVGKVELREGTAVLATQTYTVTRGACGGTHPLDQPRIGTLTADLGIGSHRIYLRAYSDYGVTGDSSTYTVNVTRFAPTITVNRAPSPMIGGEQYTVTWSTTDADSVSRVCTSTGTGYSGTTALAPSGTEKAAAKSEWVGYPSNCTWTANGPGGTDAATETMTTVAPTHDAELVSVTVPDSMEAGKSYSATVKLKNTGDGTWFAGSNFQLGSQNPANNTTWGLSRVNVATNVPPGGQYTFTIAVTAPSNAGVYDFDWQMIRDGSVWFGPMTSATVSVVADSGLAPVPITPPHLANADAGTLPGELAVNNAGAATYAVPIEVPPGTAGLKPSLSMSYSSQATNGPLGLGWSLGGLSSIHRCGQTIAQDGVNGRIRFDQGDRLCLDGQRLVLVNKAMSDANYWSTGAEYRTEIDGFSRITAQVTNGKRSFKVETKDHRVMLYGLAGSASNSYVKGYVRKINQGTLNEYPPVGTDPFEKGDALSWAVDSIQDRAGNYIRFSYEQDAETGEHRPAVIRYGGAGKPAHAAVQFVYEARPDAWKRYVDDARNDLRSRISHIKTYHGANLDGDVQDDGTLVRDYALTYGQSPTSGRSTLLSLQGCARNPQTAAPECMPATTFEWGTPDSAKAKAFVSRGTWAGGPDLWTTNVINGHTYSANHSDYFAFADFENHGYADVLEMRVASPVQLGSDNWDSFARQQWLTKDANSKLAGTVQNQYRYFHNTGSAFAQYQYKISTNENFVTLQTGDFNGDGAPDLIVEATTANGTKVPRICLSPLAKNGPQSPTIVFNCSSGLAATGQNTNSGIPHVLDVVGDGRSALYSRFDDQLRYAILCIQDKCVNDTGAPVNYLGFTYAVCCNPPMPLSTYVRFDEMVDFAGTGKQQDARWTKAHYVKTWCDDGGGTCTYVNAWRNTQPMIFMTGFRQPDSADSAYGAGSLGTYLYDDYVVPGCPPDGCAASLPPYDFNVGKNAVGDFNGSGYSGLLFGFIEFVRPNGGYNKSDLTLCLSTGRRLDCGVRRKYSGAQYVAPGSVGNYVGDGLPTFGGLPTQMVDGVMQYGSRQMCRVTGDDTTGGMGTGDTNIVCEPWDGPDPIPGHEGIEMDLLGTGRPQSVVDWQVYEPVDRAKTNQALDRIHAVTNGLGARSYVEYVDGVPSGTVTRSGNSSLSYPQHVTGGVGKIVKRLHKANGAEPDLTTSYQYVDPGIDVAGRGSLGFAQVIATDEQRNIVTTTTYSQTWPFVGMATNIKVAKKDAACDLSNTTNRLAAKSIAHGTYGATTWPFVAGSTVVKNDLDCETLGKVTTSGKTANDVQYDVWGNLLDMKVVSEGSATDSAATFTTVTENTPHTADQTHWLVDLVDTIKVSKSQSGDAKVITRTKDFIYEDGYTGRVKTEKIQDGNDALRLTIDYDRTGNAFGLVKTRTETWKDPLTLGTRSRQTTTEYDANGRLPVKVTNPLGQFQTSDYDYGSGAPTRHTDLNQLVTSWIVDGFGRAQVEIHPDGNEIHNFVKKCDGACPSGAVAAKITDRFYGLDRNAVPQVAYLDSAGRVLQSKTWGFDGSVIVADQRYDDLGRLWETDQPHFSADTAYLANRQEYDDLNRVVKVTTKDEQGNEQSLTTDYQGMVTVITNAKGQQRTDKRDVLGQVREVVDALQGSTKFAYDPFGNLTQTTDPNGNVITVVFDDLGRKTDLKDPDLGWIQYVPDPLGRTRKQVSPEERKASKSTTMDYDNLDRMVVRVEPDLESHWDFDTASGKGVGQLAEAYTVANSIKDYRRIHTYDGLGRPGTTTQVLTDGNYTSTPAYDDWGRVKQQTYQRGSDAAKVFTLAYNSYGYQSSIQRPGLDLWKVLAQDAANRVTSAQLGNGLIDSQTYSAYTGRMETGMVKTAADVVRLQEGYTYDALGNVMERQQLWDLDGFIENFDYDELNRLLWSEVVNGSGRKNFNYDAAGNLKFRSGAGTYTYPAQGASAVQPHAVQSASNVDGGSPFSYDGNGNLLTGASRTISWTSFDMPVTITKGSNSSTFAYGPEHQRAKQLRGDGTTIVYAGAQEVETKAGITTVKTYWPGGVGLEIDKTGQSGTQLMWTHADRLGSPVSITDVSGNLAEKLAYDAWGKRRTLDGKSIPDSLDGVVDNKGFTHHEMLDQLDLVHMNGRVYDPLVARFVSGDPLVQDPVNGQNYNRYSYVLNNPTNLTDPTGFASCADTPHVCEREQRKEDKATAAFQQAYNKLTPEQQKIFIARNPEKAQQLGLAVKGKDGTDKVDAKGGAGAKGDANGPGLRIPDYRSAQSTIAVGRTAGEIEDAQHISGALALGFVPGSGIVDGAEQIKSASGPGGVLLGVGLMAMELPGLKQVKGLKVFEVGTYDALKGRSIAGDGLDIHHVMQKHPAGQAVSNYDPLTAPSIALPRREHSLIQNLRGVYTGTARDLLARDIRNLRNFTNAPNISLQELIDLNKSLYPGALAK